MRTKTVLEALASLVEARANCLKSGNADWHEKHTDAIEALVKAAMPSGSGFDAGTMLDLDRSQCGGKLPMLVFVTSYHHMTEHGCYDGWTEHEVIVTPTFGGMNLRVTGKDRNETKDYIAESFHYCLSADAGEP